MTEIPRPRRQGPKDPDLAKLYKLIGANILQLREEAGLSQKAVCDAVFGASTLQGEWSRWERGLIMPNIATLHQIASYFGVSISELGLFDPASQKKPKRAKSARAP